MVSEAEHGIQPGDLWVNKSSGADAIVQVVATDWRSGKPQVVYLDMGSMTVYSRPLNDALHSFTMTHRPK